jgi:excisionase family DNA binding protein
MNGYSNQDDLTPNSLLTIDEARSILRVGRNVMYDLIKQGLPHVRVGKQIRIPYNRLMLWVESQTVAS